MKIKARQAFTFILAFILAGSFLVLPGYAAQSEGILSLTANYSGGRVSVSGTASSDVFAVALLLYDTDGTTLLRMETVGVTLGENENTFSGSILISLSPGTYTVKAANYEGGDVFSASFTVPAYSNNNDDGGGSSPPAATASIAPTPTPTPVPVYYAAITSGANHAENLAIILDETGENALTSLDQENLQSLFSESNEPVISLPVIPGVNTYTLELPASALSKPEHGSTLTISTDAGTLVIPDNMLSALSGTELENPDSIIIWYLDGNGNLVCIPNGRYDPATGEVTFTTTHFSLYAVGYSQISFNDVEASAWYQKAVNFIAARQITKGTGAGKFTPEALLTRGKFIVMLMRACCPSLFYLLSFRIFRFKQCKQQVNRVSRVICRR